MLSKKMTERLTLLVLLFWYQELVEGIRVLDLRVPAHAAEGGTALLGCDFDLEGDQLYSVKWYKNNREFYRYVPMNKPPISHFPTPGITVDVSRSSSSIVALTHLKQSSAGLYRCEVSGEAPKFSTASDQKYITIHYLPQTGPSIIGLQKEYQIGDRAAFNCTSKGSTPEAQLKWLVNDKPVAKEHVRGPWYRVSRERMSATETILELRFTVMPKHFKSGVLNIKCQAIIAPLYQDEVVHQILWDDNAYSTVAASFTPIEENLTFPPPVYNEIKHLGFPPLDEDTSEEITMADNTANLRTCLNYLIVIMLCTLFIM